MGGQQTQATAPLGIFIEADIELPQSISEHVQLLVVTGNGQELIGVEQGPVSGLMKSWASIYRFPFWRVFLLGQIATFASGHTDFVPPQVVIVPPP